MTTAVDFKDVKQQNKQKIRMITIDILVLSIVPSIC